MKRKYDKVKLIGKFFILIIENWKRFIIHWQKYDGNYIIVFILEYYGIKSIIVIYILKKALINKILRIFLRKL